jgi:hypothetical protein
MEGVKNFVFQLGVVPNIHSPLVPENARIEGVLGIACFVNSQFCQELLTSSVSLVGIKNLSSPSWNGHIVRSIG